MYILYDSDPPYTVDSVMCGPQYENALRHMWGLVVEILRPEGIYILISVHNPETMLPMVETADLPWDVTVHAIPKPAINPCTTPDLRDLEASYHFMYVCIKRPQESHEQKDKHPKYTQQQRDFN